MKYFETGFHIFYLGTLFYMAFKMILVGKKDKMIKLFGIMALVLGIGDSFHLIPRVYALQTTGLEANAVALGIGKLITSITMTIFYGILIRIWEMRFSIKNDMGIRIFSGVLIVLRITLSLMPQNEWKIYEAPINWGIYRNIPFTMLGILVVYLILNQSSRYKDKEFRKVGIGIIISFICYWPVVLFANTYKLIGMLMIPKTLAYLWIVYIGYRLRPSK